MSVNELAHATLTFKEGYMGGEIGATLNVSRQTSDVQEIGERLVERASGWNSTRSSALGIEEACSEVPGAGSR